MVSAFCDQCHAPVYEMAKFCLKCGARVGRRPDKAFTAITVIFFTLAGAMIAIAVLPKLGIWKTSHKPVAADVESTRAPVQRDATVLADSFCAESDTQIQQLYALIAEGNREGAAALVLNDSTLAVRAGTVVREYGRQGRLSHVRLNPQNTGSRTCWIPASMLTPVAHRIGGRPDAPFRR